MVAKLLRAGRSQNDYYHAAFPSVGDHVRFQKETLQWALKRGQDNLSWIAGSKWDNYSLYPLFFIMREVLGDNNV